MKFFVKFVSVAVLVLVSTSVRAEQCKKIEPKGWGFGGATCVPLRKGEQFVKVGELFFTEQIDGQRIEMRIVAIVGHSAFVEVSRHSLYGNSGTSSTAVTIKLKPGASNTSQATIGTLSTPLLVRMTGAPVGNEIPVIIN
jgi:phosphohistidine phosphatase SixA